MKNISLKKNFIMNSFLTMSSFIFPLITFPYISRIIGPSGIGTINFVTSFINYFSMVAQLGIPTYGIRACAKVRDNKNELTKVAQELLIINLITTVISYIGLGLCLIYIPKFHVEKTLYIIISFSIILTSIGMEWLYKALEQYTYIAVRSILFKFIALIAMFMLIHTKEDYVIYGAITIFAASASNVLNFINVHKYIGIKPVGNYNFKRHIRYVMVFFAMTIATTIYTNLDNVMLGFMASDIDVGYYSAAIKIKSILLSLVTSLGTVLLPRVSYYIEKNRFEDFKRIYEKAFEFVIIIACPLTIFFILFAKESIFFLSGNLFEGAIRPMQLIMPTVLIIGLSNITGMQILVPIGKEKIVLYSEIAGAIVDCVINALMIPKFKACGASIGTLIAELIVLFYQVYNLKDHLKTFERKIGYNGIIIGLVLSSSITIPIKFIGFGCFTTLLIAFIVFFGIYFLILLINKEKLLVDIFEQISHKYFYEHN